VTLRSAIYTGRVRHRRVSPRHAFTFPLFMVYLDLAELDEVCSLTRSWGTSRFQPARFRREDYLTRSEHDGPLGLAESVRACVREQVGFVPEGPIRMLSHWRYFGHIFNPVTFYYCFDTSERIEAIVAEITNTPWGERHAYALDARAPLRDRPLRWRFNKEFHVSPFLPMELGYDWTFTPPSDRLFVHMNLTDPRTAKVFDATLVMRRREMSPGVLWGVLARYPFMTLQVLSRIHFEALRLWIKGTRIVPHPARGASRSRRGVSESTR
jgi:DUF1365 family protein